MNCSQPGSSVRRIFQVRILEWGPSGPRDQTWVSCTGRWIVYHWATREAKWISTILQRSLILLSAEGKTNSVINQVNCDQMSVLSLITRESLEDWQTIYLSGSDNLKFLKAIKSKVLEYLWGTWYTFYNQFSKQILLAILMYVFDTSKLEI